MAASSVTAQSPEFSHHSFLDRLLATRRLAILAWVALLILLLVTIEWIIQIEYSLGVIYILPVMLGGLVLNRRQIVLLAFICASAPQQLLPSMSTKFSISFWW